MTALCRSCDGEFDANDFCPRCQHYASEQLPEKTLDQLFDENPACRAYRDAIRARLWGFDVLGEQLTETLPDPFGDAFQARALAASQSRRVSPSRPRYRKGNQHERADILELRANTRSQGARDRRQV